MWNLEISKSVDDGYSKILGPRVISTLVWSFLLQFVTLFLYKCIHGFSLSSPVYYLKDCVYILLTFKTWFCMVLLFILVASLAIIKIQSMNNLKPCYNTRFQRFLGFFNRYNLVCGVLYSAISVSIVLTYSFLSGESLKYKCKTRPEEYCLNEKYLFILLNGVWCSLYFTTTYCITKDNPVYYSSIQQLTFLRVKTELPNTIKTCFIKSVWPTFIFIVIYYWKSQQFLIFTQKCFDLELEFETVSSVSGFYHLNLFLQAWLSTSVFLLHILNLRLSISVHMTQRYKFTISDPAGTSLIKSLKSNNSLIVHLAFFDLFLISTKCCELRCQIFALSNPGGHPHSWNQILQICTQTIDNFCDKLNNVNVKKLNVEPSVNTKIIYYNNQSDVTRDIRDNIFLSPGSKIRNLITKDASVPVPSRLRVKPKENVFNTKLKQLMTEFYNKPIINYFFGSLPDADINHLVVVHSQMVAWAVQSLASLASVSLIEDQYGIVLKSLPQIISTIINLKRCIDKINKSSILNLNKKFQKQNDFDNCMLNSLRTAVRQSLYKITISYADYMHELPLSKQDQEYMQSFINFKEV